MEVAHRAGGALITGGRSQSQMGNSRPMEWNMIDEATIARYPSVSSQPHPPPILHSFRGGGLAQADSLFFSLVGRDL